MNEEQRPQKLPPMQPPRPVYQLNYASPPPKPPITVARALKIILMVFLGVIGVLLLLAGVCAVLAYSGKLKID